MEIISDTIGYIFWKGLKYGAVLGALYGTTVVPIIGTLFGLFYGGVAGLILGWIGGLLIGLVTYSFFNPVRSEELFRWVVVTLVTSITYGGAIIILLKLYSTAELGDFRFVQIPALIAGGSAAYAARGFVRHYLKQHQKPDTLSTEFTAHHLM